MEILYKIRHGSDDSIDEDFYLVVDKIPTKQEYVEFKKESDIDANMITIENGIVTGCLKGLTDEINNSIYHTFDLHEQTVRNPILSEVKRDVVPKFSMVVRELLAFCSRTQYRSEIKSVMKPANLVERLYVLKKINLNDINDFEKNTKEEVYKFFAQQIGMLLPLISDSYGNENFTKKDIVKSFPTLRPYLYRETEETEELQKMFELFTDIAFEFMNDNVNEVKGKEIYLNDGRVFDVRFEKFL